MTFRDLLENHTDIIYHAVAICLGIVGAVIYIVKTPHTVDGGLIALVGTFMAGGVANAKWNPNT
jgi:hypothetical protein